MNPTKFEVVPDLPYEDYAARPHVSSSILKLVLTESLLTVRAALDGKAEKESEALDFGKAFHSLIEGKKDYAVQPETYPAPAHHQLVKRGEIEEGAPLAWNNTAKYCSDWHKAQSAPVMSARESESLEGMAAAVRSNHILKPYLKGRSELSAFVDCNNRLLKCRFDRLPDDPEGPIIDFKKTHCASPEKFVKQIWDYKYYVSGALYLDISKMIGQPRDRIWYVAVEDKFPHNIFIAELKDEDVSFIDLGRKEYRFAYQKLSNAIAENRWPSYGRAPAENHITAWMQKAIDECA